MATIRSLRPERDVIDTRHCAIDDETVTRIGANPVRFGCASVQTPELRTLKP